MSKSSVRTWYELVLRTSIWLEKYVLLASNTYFYHAFSGCTHNYVLSTYCFQVRNLKVRSTWPGYAQGEKTGTYLVRTWRKKYVPVQTEQYKVVQFYRWVQLGTYRYVPSTYYYGSRFQMKTCKTWIQTRWVSTIWTKLVTVGTDSDLQISDTVDPHSCISIWLFWIPGNQFNHGNIMAHWQVT